MTDQECSRSVHDRSGECPRSVVTDQECSRSVVTDQESVQGVS